MRPIVTIQARIPLHVRWMIRRDLPEVLAIEKESFIHPMDEDDILRMLRNRICMVAEHNDKVIGHMMYELYKAHFEILNLAVKPAYRRKLVGSRMINKIMQKLSEYRRNTITMNVTESNLVTQLMLRRLGFRAKADKDGRFVIDEVLHMAYTIPRDECVVEDYVETE